MAKAKPIPDLTAESTYAAAAAKIVSVRARELNEHAQGVLDTGDIERVHDMRVTTRRLRAALEIFEPCFPAKQRWRGARSPSRRLADALGERRDRDVAIAALHNFNDQMATPPIGVESPSPDRAAPQTSREKANEELSPLWWPRTTLRELRETMEDLVEGGRGCDRREGPERQEARPGGTAGENAARIVLVRIEECCALRAAGARTGRRRGPARHADRREAAPLRARGDRFCFGRPAATARKRAPASCRTSSARSMTAT